MELRLNEKITDSNVLIACVILNIETVMASEKISYDNIKFLYVCPFLTDFMDGKIRVVENVPRYIFPLMSQRPFIKDGRAYLPLRLTFHILDTNSTGKTMTTILSSIMTKKKFF